MNFHLNSIWDLYMWCVLACISEEAADIITSALPLASHDFAIGELSAPLRSCCQVQCCQINPNSDEKDSHASCGEQEHRKHSYTQLLVIFTSQLWQTQSKAPHVDPRPEAQAVWYSLSTRTVPLTASQPALYKHTANAHGLSINDRQKRSREHLRDVSTPGCPCHLSQLTLYHRHIPATAFIC